MAQQKLPLKDILAAIDMGGKSVWDELSEDEQKQVSFWLMNRYVSSVKGNREKQELAVSPKQMNTITKTTWKFLNILSCNGSYYVSLVTQEK